MPTEITTDTMPTIKLSVSERTYNTLLNLQLWHDKHSPSDTIAFLAHQYIQSNDVPPDFKGIGTNDPGDDTGVRPDSAQKSIENVHPSDLSHTKPVFARIGTAHVESIPWKNLLIVTFQQLVERGISPADIVRTLTITAVTDNSLDYDYPHDPVSNITFNPQSAPTIWEQICILSSAFDLTVDVKFRWTDNPKAVYRGQQGVVRHKGTLNNENRKIKVLIPKATSQHKRSERAPKLVNSDNVILHSEDNFLKKTKITTVYLDYAEQYFRTWIDIFKAILSFLRNNRSFTVKELISEIDIKVVDGYFNDVHYTYISELDCSLKYPTASDVGREITRLCDKYDIPIEIHFRWQNSDEALYPDEQSILLAGGLTNPTGEGQPF